jgi:predicted dehydrogenase
MHLNFEEKQIGKENFLAAIASPFVPRGRKDDGPTSRKFLEDIVRKGLGSAPRLRAAYFGYDEKLDKPLCIGIIGTGEQGCRLIAALNKDFVTVKSIADIRPSSIKRATGGQKKKDDEPAPPPGLKDIFKDWKFSTYGPYQDLIAHAKDDELEAVIIALPTHLHAEAAEAALKAGLHVFLETPLAATVADCKRIVRALDKANEDRKDDKLCLAVGQQRYYSLLYDNAVALAQSGLLGKLHYIRAHWHSDAEAGKRSVPKGDEKVDVKKFGYKQPEELFSWQLFERTAGGLMAHLGSQLVDASALFLATVRGPKGDEIYPLSVAGSAGQVLPESLGDMDDHAYCVLEFPIEGYVEKGPPKTRKKIGFQFAVTKGNDFDGYGETILGTEGTLVLEREQEAILYKVAATTTKLRVVKRVKIDKDTKKETPMAPGLDPRESGDEESGAVARAALLGADPGFAAELEHWAWCVRKASAENQPRCGAKQALSNAVIALTAGLAAKQGVRIDFKKSWFDATSKDTPEESMRSPSPSGRGQG